MASKGGNRQQKQAAKAVRRRQAVTAKQQTARLASSLSGRIATAAASPVERCLRLDDMVASGIGHVILAKRLPSGALGCAFFLVDLLCLGVKDTFFREMAPSDLDEQLRAFDAGGQAMVPIDPASAKALIMGSVAFAAASGLRPDKDYRAVVRVFDGIDAAEATEGFGFGRDGRPVYIPGPNDSPSRMREIQQALTKARGTEGWTLDTDLAEAGRIVGGGSFDGDDVMDEGGLDDDDIGPVIDHEGPTEPPQG